MTRIIFIDGYLADAMGAVSLRYLAQQAADLSKEAVSIITMGETEYHADKRYSAEPSK